MACMQKEGQGQGSKTVNMPQACQSTSWSSNYIQLAGCDVALPGECHLSSPGMDQIQQLLRATVYDYAGRDIIAFSSQALQQTSQSLRVLSPSAPM